MAYSLLRQHQQYALNFFTILWNRGIRDSQGTVENCPEFWGGLISQIHFYVLMDGWIRFIVGFQPLMVISPTGSWIPWCMQCGNFFNLDLSCLSRTISMHWIGIGTEVAVLNFQVVPIPQVVLKTKSHKIPNRLQCWRNTTSPWQVGVPQDSKSPSLLV